MPVTVHLNCKVIMMMIIITIIIIKCLHVCFYDTFVIFCYCTLLFIIVGKCISWCCVYNCKFYHTSNSRYNVWESMGKPCSCTRFIKSRIFLLQVTRESVSGTSHVRCVCTCNEIGGSYDKIIITIVPSKLSLVCCRRHCYSCCALVKIQTATNS